MATGLASYAAPPPEEDYIDMEVSSSSSSSNLFCYSIGSPPQSRDFEFQFQMTSFSDQTEPTTSPADELFYKGKLLPLHLPPRLQMVQKLLHSSSSDNTTLDARKGEAFSENFQIPFISITAPLESCNTSPTESCRASCELNPDEYLLGWRGGTKGFMEEPPRKSWSKKIKQLKLSSQAYLKALFGKSACANKSCAKAVFNEDSENILEERENAGKYIKVGKKSPFGRIDYNKWQMPNSAFEKEKGEEYCGIINNHRRSFSGAIQRASATKSSSSSSTSSSGSSSLSSSFSFSSNGFSDPQLFKRSISANSEIESSIEGAIAHCKQSQKLFGSRKNETESQSETCRLSASKVLPCVADQKSSGVCSI